MATTTRERMLALLKRREREHLSFRALSEISGEPIWRMASYHRVQFERVAAGRRGHAGRGFGLRPGAGASVRVATHFLTVDAWTMLGLVRYYVLVFIQLGSRRVEIAGIPRNPTEHWMAQVARNVTMEGVGFLNGMKFLLHDRDTKFSEHFRRLIRDGGVRPVALPARSPDLNAFVERWIRTVKDECLGRLIFFGRSSVERALRAYVQHYPAERNHQGIGNVLPNPRALDRVGGVNKKVVRRGSPYGLRSFYLRRAG